MDFLKWWWWHVLDSERRGDVFAFLSVIGIVITVMLFVYLHSWFYPWIYCMDLFLVITVPSGLALWYFSRQHKAWQERDEGGEDS